MEKATYRITYYFGTHKHKCNILSLSITDAIYTFSITYDVPVYNIVSCELVVI